MDDYEKLKRKLKKYYKKARRMTTRDRVKLYISMGIPKIPVDTRIRKQARQELFIEAGGKDTLIPSQQELGR